MSEQTSVDHEKVMATFWKRFQRRSRISCNYDVLFRRSNGSL